MLFSHRFLIRGVGGGLRLCDLVAAACTVSERCLRIIAVLGLVHRELVRLTAIESHALHGV